MGKGVLREFGKLSRDITVEGLVLGVEVIAGVATLGLSAPSSKSRGRNRTRRRRR